MSVETASKSAAGCADALALAQGSTTSFTLTVLVASAAALPAASETL